ncbi:hypothetical protein IAT40_008024 [Kwoniella sp. CBS 6097]
MQTQNDSLGHLDGRTQALRFTAPVRLNFKIQCPGSASSNMGSCGTVDGCGPQYRGQHQSTVWVHQIDLLTAKGDVTTPDNTGSDFAKHGGRGRYDSLRDCVYAVQKQGPYRLEPIACQTHMDLLHDHQNRDGAPDLPCVSMVGTLSACHCPAQLRANSLYEGRNTSAGALEKIESQVPRSHLDPGSTIIDPMTANYMREVANGAHPHSKTWGYSVNGIVSWVHNPTNYSTWVRPAGQQPCSWGQVPLQLTERQESTQQLNAYPPPGTDTFNQSYLLPNWPQQPAGYPPCTMYQSGMWFDNDQSNYLNQMMPYSVPFTTFEQPPIASGGATPQTMNWCETAVPEPSEFETEGGGEDVVYQYEHRGETDSLPSEVSAVACDTKSDWGSATGDNTAYTWNRSRRHSY